MSLATATTEPLIDSSELLEDAHALRARAEADGYLLLKGLLPREAVMAVRQDFVTMLMEIGWLKAGTEPMDAIAGRSAIIEGEEAFYQAFDRFQRMVSFHALSRHTRLLSLYETMFGEPILAHPRNIGRVLFPDTPATPPHQDFLHVRGARDTWTAWIPLGDLPAELGGLALLPGSHKLELLPTTKMPGAGGQGIDDPRLDRPWHTTTFEAGDVLTFHSHTIHGSLPNHTPDRMRLSVDYRYQRASDVVDQRSLKPHHGKYDWDVVYEGWPSTTKWLQYDWQELPLTVIDAFAQQGQGGY